MRASVAACAVGLLVAACRGTSEGNQGSISVSWTGADTGKLEFPAQARWCVEDSVLAITGERGDSGIGLAFYPSDSVASGTFPVDGPGQSQPRPHARVALRWFGENLIAGYYSLSGVARVSAMTPLGGDLQATLRSAVDGNQLNLRGSFSGLAIRPAPTGCGKTIQPDSGVR